MIDLKEVIIKYPGCLENASKLRSYLVDLYPEEKRNITIITTIFDCGIAEEIKKAKGAIDEIVISSYCNRLENIYAYSPKFSRECLLLWSDVYKVGVKTEDRKPNTVKIKETETKKIEDTTSENNIKVGDIIKFGSYWQNNSKSKCKTPIKWRVLSKKNNKILIISEKGLDCKPYNTSYARVTWETCSLRSWLNETFLNSAFTTAKQSKVKSTTVSADKNPSYNTSAGNATTDKVFLLSITEVEKYFTNFEARKCVPTAYAKANGAYTKDGKPTCWWLRSSGYRQHHATRVFSDGSVRYYGNYVFGDYACVRPALWIILDSLTNADKRSNSFVSANDKAVTNKNDECDLELANKSIDVCTKQKHEQKRKFTSWLKSCIIKPFPTFDDDIGEMGIMVCGLLMAWGCRVTASSADSKWGASMIYLFGCICGFCFSIPSMVKAFFIKKGNGLGVLYFIVETIILIVYIIKFCN